MNIAWRIARWLILALWLVLVVLYIRGERGRQKPVAVPATGRSVGESAGDNEGWMGVYLGEKKIGYTRHRVDSAGEGHRFEEQSLLRISVMDTQQTVRMLAEGETGPDHALRTFRVSLRSGLGDLQVRGTVSDSAVDLIMVTGGEERTEHVPLAEPIYLPSNARDQLRAQGFAPGRTLTVTAFDPTAMQNFPLVMRVEAQETLATATGSLSAWRVHESFRGMETTVWFDDAGQPVREQGPMGMVAVRESAQDAVGAGWSDDAAFDLMSVVAVPVREPIAAPRELARLRVRIGGLGDIVPPSDGRQTYRDGTLQIEPESAAASASYHLPYEAAEWRGDLAQTPFLQVDHPRIRSTAEEILAGERDALPAAVRLREWVFARLEKVPTASIPNALQVLQMGAGDCNEHAVLYAALARAAGLPARVVAGTVYVDGVFLYHAWNEVWLGQGWVSVDPTFDQMPADATHIKLIEGGPEVHAALVPILGRLSISVIPTDGDPG